MLFITMFLNLWKSWGGKVKEEEKYTGNTNVELLWRIDDSFIEIERAVRVNLAE